MSDLERVTTLNAASGDVYWTGVRANFANGQVIAGSDWTSIASVDFGASWIAGGTFPTPSLICPQAGVYSVAATIRCSSTVGYQAWLKLTVNGTEKLSWYTPFDVPQSPLIFASVIGAVQLNTFDDVRLIIDTDGPPQDITIIGSASESYLCLTRVGG